MNLQFQKKLANAGTTLLGKTNLDEFAMGTMSKTSFFGAPINPYQRNRKLTAGGSSGGSTSSVAGGLALIATGTDTGGSIRFPASITGLVGMKPTYGVCSRWGCVAFASSLDHPGPIARSVDDCALMLSAMAGHDPRESTSSQHELLINNQPLTIKGMKIGVIKELEDVAVSSDMKSLWMHRTKDLQDLGAQIISVSIPNILDALAAYYIIAPAEASSNLARYDGMRYGLRVPGKDLIDTYMKTRAAGFGQEVQRRMVIGTAVLSSESYDVYFMQAARVRRMIADAFDAAFAQCDLIICPSGAGTAFPLDSKMTPLEEYALDLFTVAMNLAGVPAVSVPAGRSADGLPLGMQVVGRNLMTHAFCNWQSTLKHLRIWTTAQHRLWGNKMTYTIKGKTGDWELVIGLETHIEVLSKSKLFSGASANYNPTVAPNTQVSMVDAAMPGMLPVLNAECVNQAIRFGLAINANITHHSIFCAQTIFLPRPAQRLSNFTAPRIATRCWPWMD